MRYINQLAYPEMPYITRQDLADERERELGKTTTVATSGCGLCSSVILIDRLLVNSPYGLEDALRMSVDIGANRRIGTSYRIFAPALAERFGLDLEMTADPERLRYCLRTGGCAVAESDGDREGHVGLFTHNAHFFVVIAEQRDGRLVILDPALKEGKYDEEGRRGKVEVRGDLILCDMETLVEDTLEPEVPFYLFWRKEN